MISRDEIQILLERLYEYISFEPGEDPHVDMLKELFIEGASVIEYLDEGCQKHVQKDIERHIEEINRVFRGHPEITSKGFREKELDNSMTIYGPMAFVKSRYEKEFFNGKENIKATGTNCLHLAKIDGRLKIVSIGWYEN
jgi:hypothetical protein